MGRAPLEEKAAMMLRWYRQIALINYVVAGFNLVLAFAFPWTTTSWLNVLAAVVGVVLATTCLVTGKNAERRRASLEEEKRIEYIKSEWPWL